MHYLRSPALDDHFAARRATVRSAVGSRDRAWSVHTACLRLREPAEPAESWCSRRGGARTWRCCPEPAVSGSVRCRMCMCGPAKASTVTSVCDGVGMVGKRLAVADHDPYICGSAGRLLNASLGRKIEAATFLRQADRGSRTAWIRSEVRAPVPCSTPIGRQISPAVSAREDEIVRETLFCTLIEVCAGAQASRDSRKPALLLSRTRPSPGGASCRSPCSVK